MTVNSKTVSAKTLNDAIAEAGGDPADVKTITLGKSVKKYKKIFTKKNAGKKVKVTL